MCVCVCVCRHLSLIALMPKPNHCVPAQPATNRSECATNFTRNHTLLASHIYLTIVCCSGKQSINWYFCWFFMEFSHKNTLIRLIVCELIFSIKNWAQIADVSYWKNILIFRQTFCRRYRRGTHTETPFTHSYTRRSINWRQLEFRLQHNWLDSSVKWPIELMEVSNL